MVDYTFKSKGKSYKSKNRKENTVDRYVANVTKNINGANWCDDEEDYEYSISKKYVSNNSLAEIFGWEYGCECECNMDNIIDDYYDDYYDSGYEEDSNNDQEENEEE